MRLAVALLLAIPLDSTSRAPIPSEPPAVPSGMDLLYSDRVPLKQSGEPLLTLGLMTGQKRITVRAAAALKADYYEAGVLKRTTIRAGDPVEITVVRARPAARRYDVDLEGIAWGRADLLDQTLAGWRARGYREVQAIEEGTVLGIGGHVLDNRGYRIVLPAKSSQAGQQRAAEVYRRFGTRAVVRARLSRRPWAELRVRAGGVPLGIATSFVRFVALDGTVQVDRVEYGRGYAWHGFEDRRYRGEIYVVVDPDGSLAAVNVLGAEAVLASVVPSEMFASSANEALKAQAVAARNQLFAKLGQRHHDDPFHLCSDQHCQVYAGVLKEDPRSSEAVRETTGQVAFLNGRLVDTVYSSTCGGHTEDNDAVWGNAPDPALRGRPDYDLPPDAEHSEGIPPNEVGTWLAGQKASYCSRASKLRPENYRWTRTLTRDQLDRRLAPYQLGTLEGIEVEERGRGGRVISLTLIGRKGTATIVHELPIRRLFGNLKSGLFVIEVDKNDGGGIERVTFHGGGWGHGVGMCQLGAIGRAEAGHTYRQILSHYYNGATVEQLYVATP